jgi:glutathione S-transferase
MSMLKVLGRATSGNVQKVLWLLEELPRDYVREDYGRQFNNTADAAYLALNPNAKVPTLVDGDIVVWESNTILRYVCNRTACDLYPEEPAERSHVERWMDWQLSVLNNPYVAIFKESKKPAEERSADLPEHGKELVAALTILDAALDGRGWLAGDGISLAEVALGPIVNRCVGFPVDLPPLPHLRAWHARMAERPAFAKVVKA